MIRRNEHGEKARRSEKKRDIQNSQLTFSGDIDGQELVPQFPSTVRGCDLLASILRAW